MSTTNRRAMTLAEMLVVLVILAVLATVAVRSLAPVEEQARYDATKRTLETLRSAIIGSDAHGSGSITANYVADHGMLPTTPEWKTLLQPYLMSQVGNASTFNDGWGNELQITAPTTDSLRIYSTEASFTLEGQPLLYIDISPGQWKATKVLGTVYCASPISGTYTVQLTGPGTVSHSTPITFSTSAQATFLFESSEAAPLPIGAWTLQVLQGSGMSMTEVARIYFPLTASETRMIEITIPAPST